MPIFETVQNINGKPYKIRVDTGVRLSTAYLWWAFLGIFGAHRFYLRRPVSGTVFACTAGLILVGWGLDVLNIPSMVKAINEDARGELT